MVRAAPFFGLVAGEASGDLLAGLLLDGLRARWPQLTTAGIGGAPVMITGGAMKYSPITGTCSDTKPLI